jgi:hypothetical protein
MHSADRHCQVVVRNRIIGILLNQSCMVGNRLIIFHTTEMIVPTLSKIGFAEQHCRRKSHPNHE